MSLEALCWMRDLSPVCTPGRWWNPYGVVPHGSSSGLWGNSLGETGGSLTLILPLCPTLSVGGFALPPISVMLSAVSSNRPVFSRSPHPVSTAASSEKWRSHHTDEVVTHITVNRTVPAWNSRQRACFITFVSLYAFLWISLLWF